MIEREPASLQEAGARSDQIGEFLDLDTLTTCGGVVPGTCEPMLIDRDAAWWSTRTAFNAREREDRRERCGRLRRGLVVELEQGGPRAVCRRHERDRRGAVELPATTRPTRSNETLTSLAFAPRTLTRSITWAILPIGPGDEAAPGECVNARRAACACVTRRPRRWAT